MFIIKHLFPNNCLKSLSRPAWLLQYFKPADTHVETYVVLNNNQKIYLNKYNKIQI